MSEKIVGNNADNKIYIYNTMGRELQEFAPIYAAAGPDGKVEVRMYHCGPTVYWNQHIGNMRAVVWADLIKRVLEYNTASTGQHYKVTLVRNYTDVGHLTGDNVGDADTGEDRMDKAARRDGKTPDEIANMYIDSYIKDITLLNANSAEYMPRVTEYIDEIIDMVQELLDKGFAYITNQGVYFDVSKYPEYTRLSGQKLDLQHIGSGHGEANDTEKRNAADFALWIYAVGAHANALQTWNTIFHNPNLPPSKLTQATSENQKDGEGVFGFPGWHIECSVMSKSILGAHFDIHMGGIEHIPVHHTNEIAQSECANGVKYVNYWLHNEHLLVDGKKMSKSEGTSYLLSDVIEYLKKNTTSDNSNFISDLAKDMPAKTDLSKEIEATHNAMALRYFFLQAHYRSKQNFTWDALLASHKAYVKLLKEIEKLNSILSHPNTTPSVTSLELGDTVPMKGNSSSNKDKYQTKFLKAINKDFNIPMALGIMWSMIGDKDLMARDKLDMIKDFNKVFGLAL